MNLEFLQLVRKSSVLLLPCSSLPRLPSPVLSMLGHSILWLQPHQGGMGGDPALSSHWLTEIQKFHYPSNMGSKLCGLAPSKFNFSTQYKHLLLFLILQQVISVNSLDGWKVLLKMWKTYHSPADFTIPHTDQLQGSQNPMSHKSISAKAREITPQSPQSEIITLGPRQFQQWYRLKAGH